PTTATRTTAMRVRMAALYRPARFAWQQPDVPMPFRFHHGQRAWGASPRLQPASLTERRPTSPGRCGLQDHADAGCDVEEHERERLLLRGQRSRGAAAREAGGRAR